MPVWHYDYILDVDITADKSFDKVGFGVFTSSNLGDFATRFWLNVWFYHMMILSNCAAISGHDTQKKHTREKGKM